MQKRPGMGKSKMVRVRVEAVAPRPRKPQQDALPSDAEIERRAESDPDNPPLTAEQLASMQRLRDAPPKVLLSLRIDAHVLAAYRRSGKGWQTRMNEVLAAAINTNAPSASTVLDDIEASARQLLTLAQQLRQRGANR